MSGNKTPKVLYGNMINLCGLYSTSPVRCEYSEELESWSEKEGNFDICQVGYSYYNGCVKFSSTSIEEVKLWTDGAMAVMNLLTKWAEI